MKQAKAKIKQINIRLGITFLILLLSLTIVSELLAEKTATADDLTLIITGSNNGNFEPCGCGGVYEGGLARRSIFFRDLKKKHPNQIIVDTGDVTASGQASQWEFLSQAYSKLGYDVIAIGEGDLRLGIETLEKYTKEYDLPMLASNLKFTVPTSIKEVIIIERGGKKLAFISVVADRWLGILPMRTRKLLKFEKPIDAITRLTKKLKGQCDAIILLSHLGQRERDQVSAALCDIDLWIDTGGHQWSGRKRIEDATQADEEAFLITDQPSPLLVSWRNDRKIGIAEIHLTPNKISVTKADMILLKREFHEDYSYIEIYDAYKYASRQDMINRMAARKPVPQSEPVKFKYVTSETCGGCHPKNYKEWKSSAHAHAFKTLEKNDRDADINCLGCHTTGYREPGGFESPMSTPEHKNVNCQSCHRVDLSDHHQVPITTTQQARKAKVLARKQMLTKSWQCQRCHVPHRSPKFDFKKYTKKVNCPRTVSNPKK